MPLPPDQLALVELLERASDALAATSELLAATAARLRQSEADDPTAGLPEVMTLEQVARHLACSVRVVERHIERGRLTAIDVGTGRKKAAPRVTRVALRKAIQHRWVIRKNALQREGAA